MAKNFHTHTFRCNHASGTDRDYVEAAIRKGLTTLGFSDHVPMPPFPDPTYYSSYRMKREQLPDYVQSVLDLKREYAKDIEILLGFEAEYYPAMFDAMRELLSPYPYDYLILGQHFLHNEVGMPAVGKETDDEARLAQYVEQICEGLQTGAFAYLAHPDIFRFAGDDEAYRRQMRKLCETANALHVPLECNLLGVRDNRHYPSERFFRLAGECNCQIITGYDAHEPTAFADPKNDRVYAFLENCGVKNIVEDFR